MWRSVVVILLVAAGAIYGGLMGALVGSFAGDASPPPLEFAAIVAGCAVVCALLGALPGVVVGLLLGVRWVLPLLGAALGATVAGAICALVTQLTGAEITPPSRTGLTGLIFLVPTVLGALIGVRRWRTLSERDRKQAVASASHATVPSRTATVAPPSPRSAR